MDRHGRAYAQEKRTMMTPQFIAIGIALFSSAASSPALSGTPSFAHDDVEPLAVKYPPDSILGEWNTQVEEDRPPARVGFVRAKDGTYTGILSWSSAPKKDVHNKDPKLRDRSVVGIVLIWNLRYDDGEYVDGYVYNPEDGGTYRVQCEIDSTELLKVRGFLGISLFGQTKTWTRYHASSRECAQ
jgi:uncharacterized protein (DUF2147 family)